MYQLFYCDLKVGDIDQIDCEFPTARGHFKPDCHLDSSPLGSHIQNYISDSISVDSIGELDNYGHYWLDCQVSCEEKYADLIDSEDWFLVDKNGTKISISVPLFHINDEISWQ